MKRFQLSLTALGVLLLATAGWPVSGQEADANADLLNVTCADYLEGLRIANPGEQATAEQKAAAEDAQDDIVSALMWVHGYTSGRHPAPGTRHPAPGTRH